MPSSAPASPQPPRYFQSLVETFEPKLWDRGWEGRRKGRPRSQGAASRDVGQELADGGRQTEKREAAPRRCLLTGSWLAAGLTAAELTGAGGGCGAPGGGRGWGWGAWVTRQCGGQLGREQGRSCLLKWWRWRGSGWSCGWGDGAGDGGISQPHPGCAPVQPMAWEALRALPLCRIRWTAAETDKKISLLSLCKLHQVKL